VSFARLNLVTMKERYELRYAKAKGRRNLYRWFFQNEDETATVEWLCRTRRPMSLEDLYYFGATRTHILAKAGDAALALLEESYRQSDAAND
jgi:hypothetical protein